MNNSLKTINTVATIISLKKESNTLAKQSNTDNTDNTLVKQLNTDNTLVKQSNTDNTDNNLVKQLNTANTFVTLPKWLKSLKCIINPMNNKKGDNKCFEYSVAPFRHGEMGSNYNRINKIKPFL